MPVSHPASRHENVGYIDQYKPVRGDPALMSRSTAKGGLLGTLRAVPSSRAIVVAAFLVLAVFLAATGWISWHRGIWYDEIWSLYFSSHELGIGRALTEWWLQDNHPPAFYALAWLTSPFFAGEDIFARRMLNIAPIILAVAAMIWLARPDRRVRNFVIIVTLLVLGTVRAFDSMIEYRSYFTQLCASLVLAAALFRISVGDEDHQRGDTGVLLVLAAALLVSFNLHYIAAFIAGMVVAIFICALWLTGKRRWAVRILIVAIAAGVPLVIAYLVERGLLQYAAKTFWTTTTTRQAVREIKRVILSGFPLNGIAVAVALWAVVDLVRGRREALPVRGACLFAVTLALALAMTIAALLVVNSVRPFIIPRYLTPMAPFVAAVLAALSAELLLRHRWLLGVSVLAACAAIFSAFRTQLPIRQWDATAQTVADAVRRCPSTLVHARPRWIIEGDDPPQTVIANEVDVVRFGYHLVAGQHGFTLEPEAGRRVSADCPTLLWIEQHFAAPPDKLAVWADLPLSEGQIARAQVIKGETGFVVVYPPAASVQQDHVIRP